MLSSQCLNPHKSTLSVITPQCPPRLARMKGLPLLKQPLFSMMCRQVWGHLFPCPMPRDRTGCMERRTLIPWPTREALETSLRRLMSASSGLA
jgi:hypothetical protein